MEENNQNTQTDNTQTTKESVGSPFVIDENKVIRTIVLGSDWQEVLVTLVGEEGLDPMNVDIVKLADSFKKHLESVQQFDFKVPARFILVAAILLRMKAEQLLEEEEKKKERTESLPSINIENIPPLTAPITRKTTRRVTMDELIGALNKAFEFKERKEGKTIRMRRAVENLIGEEEDIEVRIARVYGRIEEKKEITFSDLVGDWTPRHIVEIFLPILYLSNRGKITCEQSEMFQEIFIKVREDQEAATHDDDHSGIVPDASPSPAHDTQ
ncbi:MAG: segregation/condensation protein A [Candidatus Aenigmarchaeota archaeon]|nr:segregation/condensation protein A [Candidatus Aenigmarchaeota archaeon]